MKCEACRAFNLFFATSLKNSIIQEHDNVRFYLSYDIQITLKSHFLCKKTLYSCHFMYANVVYGRHNVSRKSVNH